MLEVIRKRRSIRKYRNEPVTDEQLEILLRAGMQAPSARNLQPWEFVVTRDKALMARVPDVHPYSSMVPGAGAVILVCGNLEIQPETGYIAEDCSAAVQNILLEAVNQNLGAVWLGVFPRTDRITGVSELFHLPGHILPVALISLGVPGEEKQFENRFNPSKVHTDCW